MDAIVEQSIWWGKQLNYPLQATFTENIIHVMLDHCGDPESNPHRDISFSSANAQGMRPVTITMQTRLLPSGLLAEALTRSGIPVSWKALPHNKTTTIISDGSKIWLVVDNEKKLYQSRSLLQAVTVAAPEAPPEIA